MKWQCLSVPINQEIVVYKNLESKKPQFENTRNFTEHGIYESTLHLPLHTGTHVDYPLHAIENGKTSSDYNCFPTEFQAYVLDLSDEKLKGKLESIGVEHLREIELSHVEALFIKTMKTPLTQFDFEFPWLNREGAAYLASLPLKLVGIDQLGIERNQPGHETHKLLLGRDILIIEGLDLTKLETGIYSIKAFTLNIQEVEAEPILVYAMPVAK